MYGRKRLHFTRALASLHDPKKEPSLQHVGAKFFLLRNALSSVILICLLSSSFVAESFLYIGSVSARSKVVLRRNDRDGIGRILRILTLHFKNELLDVPGENDKIQLRKWVRSDFERHRFEEDLVRLLLFLILYILIEEKDPISLSSGAYKVPHLSRKAAAS